MYKSQTQFIIVKENNVLEKIGNSFVYVPKSVFKKDENDIKWYPEVFKNKQKGQKNHTITITIENVPARVLKSLKKTASK